MKKSKFYTVVVGHAVLRTFAQKRNAIRWAERYGGDDFTVYLGPPERGEVVDVRLSMPGEVIDPPPLDAGGD